MDLESVRVYIVLDTVDTTQFDVLEVQRSKLTANGPYEEVTAATYEGARLPKGASGVVPDPAVSGPLVLANGMTLEFKIQGVSSRELTVTLSGSDPLSYGQVAQQIVAQSGQYLKSWATSSQLIIETVEIGPQVTLEITGGDAAPALGLPIGVVAQGKRARHMLENDKNVYEFVDPYGSQLFFYRVRQRHSITGLLGTWVGPFQAKGVPTQLEPIIGYVDMIDGSGRPLPDKEVLVYGKSSSQLIGGRVVAPLSERRLTDVKGRARFQLLRGQHVTVAIMGTDIVREVTVPTSEDVTLFNLLDPGIARDDAFDVQVPDVPYANRTTL